MFIKGSLREHERNPFIAPLKYSISESSMPESGNLQQVAISVDISPGGIGIITDFPLKTADVLTFENAVKINDMISRDSAVVQWSGKISNRYRIGLKFV
jgi:hypothetical protein